MVNNGREIKFRAWLENSKRMVEVCNIAFHNKEITYQEDLCGDFYSEKADNFILMRYTGLKDTKDVEIYEGDIVKYYDKTYEIKWMFSGFYLHDPKGGFIELAECDECCEVIGNIYENPELLEVKDEIKKEWEKLGYKWKEEGREITLEHKERSREIYIDKIDKAYYSGYFLIFQELNLLTKTFKTLGWEE